MTDIRNNLLFYNDEAGIEIYLAPDPNDVPDTENIFTIEQNTCDAYQLCGITVHGVAEPNEAPTIYLRNNIVSRSDWYGLNLVDGYMQMIVANTGYYDNWNDKNWEFDEYHPVYAETNPYYPYIGEKPYQLHYLAADSVFVDAGAQYIEQTKLIGMTTNFDGLPDKDIVDLGFHSMDWNYTGGEGIAGTDIDDVVTLADYWLTYTPYDPNSPNYQDPNIVAPNLIRYGGDWNGDGFVDLADFAILAGMWKAAPEVPNLVPVINGDPNDGWIQLSVSGCNSDTQLVYAYANGRYVGQVYMLGDAIPVTVDVSESGNIPQEIKFMAIDGGGHFAYSEISEICYTSPLSYCILPRTHEPNEPIPFAAYNIGAGDATVEVYGNGGQLVWSQNFTDNTISGSIPASLTGEQSIIDYIHFTSASGGSVSKTTFPKVPWGTINTKATALLIIADGELSRLNPYVRLKVLQAFIDRGVEYVRLEGSEATWENIARYGQHGFIKYVYFLGHGDYKYEYGDPNDPTVIYRTRNRLVDGICLPCKASEWTTPPSWCKPFPENIERSVHTWASMGFDRLTFFYTEQCYGGRLKIDGTDNLIEGPSGAYGVTDFSHSDMTLALGMGDTYEPRCYHGWWQEGWVGWAFPSNVRSTYQEWGKNVWQKLGEGKTLEDALNYAINNTEFYHPESAVMNYRLKGRGEYPGIRIKK